VSEGSSEKTPHPSCAAQLLESQEDCSAVENRFIDVCALTGRADPLTCETIFSIAAVPAGTLLSAAYITP
jgi:hypothetical protein